MFTTVISSQLTIPENQVKATIDLLDEKCTVPFISRYRKEVTNGLDEVQVLDIQNKYTELKELSKRKASIEKALIELGEKPELLAELQKLWTSKEVEDFYLPFKPKRKTKASVAIENGLTPLAKMIMKQNDFPLFQKAKSYISDVYPSEEEVLLGARHIIAEWISENQAIRNMTRKSFQIHGTIKTKGKSEKDEEKKFESYYDREEKLKYCAGHRFLAIMRGVNEGILSVKISTNEQDLRERVERYYLRSNGELANQIKEAIKDSLKRLVLPSISNEFKSDKKEQADKEAINVFTANLRQLLLAPPIGAKRVLAIDPGYRTGCKIVCLDERGNLLHNETIYPHPPKNDRVKALKKLATLVNAYKINALAIGNGTAGRETEYLVKNVKFDRKVNVYVVNEAGASVYSASKIAREEFPNYDVTVRGAVSIGRRLCDPLAELVKIDPKSIGVGQYQHDVNQAWLKAALDAEVISCVNHVGVDLNTASKHLLSYVSGLTPSIANAIETYRKENGHFKNRKELLNVPKLGEKAFEQCAGFLKINESEEVLDRSAVHPEWYDVVKKMSKKLGIHLEDVIGDKTLVDRFKSLKATDFGIGDLTKSTIIEELEKAGRDPRKVVLQVEFDPKIRKVSDLEVGMEMKGIVTNITNFGAFVDVGVKQDGLVHLSQITDRFISTPNEVLKLNQVVNVKVVQVDLDKNRIGFTMKGIEQP